MNTSLRAKIINIGNSRGIRIPRTIIDQIGLTDDVELKVEGKTLIVQSIYHPRQGWDDSFTQMATNKDDQLLDELTPTQWDEDEWTW